MPTEGNADMKRSLAILLIALVHFAGSYVLYFVSIAIGMKGFDSPHVLTSFEKIWTSLARGLLLPIADPLMRLTRGMTLPIVSDPSHGVMRTITVTVWFFGPLALNSMLWAALIWLAYSRVTRKLGRVRAA